jgi:hypothetical protein
MDVIILMGKMSLSSKTLQCSGAEVVFKRGLWFWLSRDHVTARSTKWNVTLAEAGWEEKYKSQLTTLSYRCLNMSNFVCAVILLWR